MLDAHCHLDDDRPASDLSEVMQRARDAGVRGFVQADGAPRAGGMVHSFTGSAEIAQRWVELGFHLSFSGSVTRAGRRQIAGGRAW